MMDEIHTLIVSLSARRGGEKLYGIFYTKQIFVNSKSIIILVA